MSSTIWTRHGGTEAIAPLAGLVYRVVELQHRPSTAALTGNAADQTLLENLIETAKPPRPAEPRIAQLHWLLWSPFRYQAAAEGTRFGSAGRKPVWYGSEQIATALAERAFHFHRFVQASPTLTRPVPARWTDFAVPLATDRGVDLTDARFDPCRAIIESKIDYTHTQQLGEAMRQDRIEACRFHSVRSQGRGVNWAVFSMLVFADSSPDLLRLSNWSVMANDQSVTVLRDTAAADSERFDFQVDDWR